MSKTAKELLSILPINVEYVQGYRNDVVVIARSNKADLLVTNLPLNLVPVDKLALCSTVAEKLLLAASWDAGMSLQYLRPEHTIKRLPSVAAEFAEEFLQPLISNEVTVQYEISDVKKWIASQIWWHRAVEHPPGTEFA